TINVGSTTAMGMTITDAVTIDGYTQPGATPNTLAVGDNAILQIELRGGYPSSTGFIGTPLTITAGGCTIRGLAIDGFRAGVGIDLTGSSATGNVISGNFIGGFPSGSGGGNSIGVGASFGASYDVIGGSSPADRNIISGNRADGIVFFDGGDHNWVLGNYIGT